MEQERQQRMAAEQERLRREAELQRQRLEEERLRKEAELQLHRQRLEEERDRQIKLAQEKMRQL